MIEWKSHRHGTGATADLGRGLTLSYSYEGMKRLTSEEPHYNVSVFGQRLKTRSASGPEAQARALRVAQEWLGEIDAKIKSADGQSGNGDG